AQSPYETDLTGRVALVLGAEDQGLDRSWDVAAPHRLKLPMQGVVDSLNVSVAAGVILYEALRQRSVF
ncbi:MAG: RNA methyltransferase, partial [Flavobacteriia bacterium]|nr:RNA methyltransferase [Flavobacteriia bacterium]